MNRFATPIYHSMPRVLQIINRLNLGGPTFIAGYLTAYLGDGYETMLLAGLKDDSEESSEFIVRNMGITPRYINKMRREINWKDDREAYKEIDAIIKEFKPDIVHTHAAKAGTLGRLAAINNNVPVILHTFHGHVFEGYFGKLKTAIFLNIERYLARKTSGIIAISNVQKEELSKKFRVAPDKKSFVIPLGIDLEKFQTNQQAKRSEFRQQYRLSDDTIAVGIIGRIVPIKNHQLFLDCWKNILSQTTKKVHAFIIGDGEDRDAVFEYCQQLNLSFNTNSEFNEINTITFTSWIIDIDIPVAGLDIIALTSNNEGTPVSLIEAQAAGKAVVSTNVGGISDIVIEGETALLAPKEDREEFSKYLLELIENETLRNKMANRSPSFANDSFGYMKMVENHRDLYMRLLSQKR
jgi:glycosyltransferase involved in cell wall biosynthesis